MFRRSRTAALGILLLVWAFGAGVADAASKPAPPSRSTSTGALPATKTPDRATFGIGPADGGTNGYFSYDSGPGGYYVAKAVITNYSHVPLTLQVYPATIGNAADGGIQVGLAGAALSDAATWIALPQGLRQVTVPASTAKGTGKAAIPFQLSVPSAAEPGDHAAAIVASLNTLGKNPKGENIRLEQRIAARVYIRVDGPLHPALQLQNIETDYHGTLDPAGHGAATVSYTLQNTGNVRLSASQAVSAGGLFGSSSNADAVPSIPVVFPGASVSVTATVPDVLPTVFEHAHVTIRPKVLNAEKSMPMAALSGSASFLAVPWTLLGIILLLLMILGVIFYVRRHRRVGARTRPAVKPRSHAAHKPRRGGRRRGAEGMSRVTAVLVSALVVLAAAVTGALSLASSAQAATAVPFTDPNAHGYLGFCDRSGHQITSGSLSAVPFVFRTVSSAPTPAGYTVHNGVKATLYAYEPIQGIDPGDWSGEALTGSTFYNNAAHPMSEATVLDYSIGSFVQQTTVLWDRLVQLRMFISEPNKQTVTATYPAAVIKITGSTWRQVQGGAVDCSGGLTKPTEEIALPASRFASASKSLAAQAASASAASASDSSGEPSSTAGSTGSTGSTESAGSTTSSGRSGASTAASSPGPDPTGKSTTGSSGSTTGSGALSDSPAGHSSEVAAGGRASSSGGGASWPLVVSVVVLALAAGGVGFWRLRLRRAAPS